MNKYKIRYKILSVCLFEIISLNMWGQYSDVSMELANSLSSMADFYSSADNYTKAIELEKQSLEIRRELFGDHSSEYILSASTLAGYFFNVGDFKNAVKYGEEIIRLYAELAGKENDEYTVLLSILVEYHHKNGTYQKMIEYQIEMIDLYEKMYGEDIQHYAFNQAVLSQFYSDIGDYPNAIEAAEKSVAVYRKNNETKDLNYMLALNNLADLYYTRGFLNGEDKSRSIKMKEEVVGIAAENYGRDNIEYAKWLSNYALYYLNANG
ncbi:MAG: tetratricopeptide repeat protein, partial [Prevotella sp.]|nr:tetratricopeptide repeat protein [Prevotella sp.]